MFSTDEQQELRKVEDGLRAQDRGFGRRLTLQQGVLRRAGRVSCWRWPWPSSRLSPCLRSGQS